MTKQIAIVGCSFTDLWTGDDELTENPKDKNSTYSWLWHAAKEHPDVIFDTYAKGGMGPLYFDMCLKELLRKKYNRVLLQLTDESRWFVPLRQEEPKHRPSWVREQITNNLRQYAFYWNTVLITGDIRRAVSKGIYQPKAITQFYKQKIDPNNHWWGPSKLTYQYSRLFNQTLDIIYGKLFDRFTYFSFFEQNVNNCNLEQNVFDFMISKYGWHDFARKYTSPDKHLNYEGSRIAYEEYIKPFVLSKLL